MIKYVREDIPLPIDDNESGSFPLNIVLMKFKFDERKI